jgi:hypothetical protein
MTAVIRQAVLYHDPLVDRGSEDDYTFFGDDDPDGPTLALSDKEWEEMGCPLQVTVTVVVGDLLTVR